MHFLIDEDIDIAVGALIASSHRVTYARDEFGTQTKDHNNVAWARAKGAVLLSGDRPLASKLLQDRRCACLHLDNLGTQELRRVTELLRVVETEHAILGDAFWMQIRRDKYIVRR